MRVSITGLFFVADVGSVEVIGVILAGWSSNNKWSLFATMRTATQMVSYEIPLGLAFVSVIVCAGTFSLQEIIAQQEGWFWNWFILKNPFLFLMAPIYLVASLAECKRAPFDLPEAESELVSGFHTEYSGMRFGLFFFAEFSNMIIVCAVATVLFLGGWHGPLLPGFVWFFIKVYALILVMMWARWTFPRLRFDQLMTFAWVILVPLAILNLLVSTLVIKLL